MTGPSWLADFLAAVMIATAAYCFSRLVAAWRWKRPTDYDVDGVHILMGVAMAGMLVPRLNPFWDSGWEVIFGAALAWFGWQSIRGYRSALAVGRSWAALHLQHVLACGAMLYMFLAVAPARTAGPGSGMSMGAGSSTTFPTLALLLTLALVGFVIWNADRFTSLTPVAALRAMTAPVSAVVGPALAARAASAAGAGAEASGTATQVAQAPTEAGAAQSAQARPPISPRLAAACEIVMGLTMGYMLITML
jgi:Domain of unknown function (DUF5134)